MTQEFEVPGRAIVDVSVNGDLRSMYAYHDINNEDGNIAKRTTP